MINTQKNIVKIINNLHKNYKYLLIMSFRKMKIIFQKMAQFEQHEDFGADSILIYYCF